MRLLIATTNPDKLREIGGLLTDVRVDLLSLHDFPPIDEPEETGGTFQENARIKALHYAPLTKTRPGDNVLTVAEDSGLEIDALAGAPGVRSARFVRPDASYGERFAEIYRRLAETPASRRTARFVCAVAVVNGNDVVFETQGVVEGLVAEAPRGAGGFGYDPIFHYPPYGCTLAEVGEEEKLRVAHRGHAFREVARWLKL